MTKREVAALRRGFAKHEKARGKRYDPELKAQARSYALRRRAEGAAYTEIGDELGLAFETVRRWCVGTRTTSRAASLVPVSVVDEATREIALVSPSGFRLEGLGLREAVLALKALG